MTDHPKVPPPQGPEPEDPPGWVEVVRAAYHAPPSTPTEDMWGVIQDGLAPRGSIDLGQRRRERASKPASGPARVVPRWGWAAAAAAVLALGVGIGRWSAPVGTVTERSEVATGEIEVPGGRGVALAAGMHFRRMESLLTTVRSDARSGRMDPSIEPWARTLLLQTRLLMDVRGDARDDVQNLLADLELVLVQILGAAGTGALGDERAREELDLTVRSLERDELLQRIRSAVPTAMAGA